MDTHCYQFCVVYVVCHLFLPQLPQVLSSHIVTMLCSRSSLCSVSDALPTTPATLLLPFPLCPSLSTPFPLPATPLCPFPSVPPHLPSLYPFPLPPPPAPTPRLFPDQNHVFGQPLERAVFLDAIPSSWRLSPSNTNTPARPISTLVTSKPHDKGSLHSVSSASALSDTPSDIPMPNASSPAQFHDNSISSFQFKSLSSSRLDGGASSESSSILVNPNRHSSLNVDHGETPLQLLRDGSSLHSLDVSAIQLEEPTTLSPRAERKALLCTSPPMVPAVVQNSIDYLLSKGGWVGWGWGAGEAETLSSKSHLPLSFRHNH